MEESILLARTQDAIRLCENSSFPKFVGFLTPDERAVVQSQISKFSHSCCFYGGYEDAERVYFGALPQWCEKSEDFFPIEAITLNFRSCDKLTHRDFLGALMSLGISRETVGDILVGEGKAVIFISKDVADFVISQLEKIGRVGVTLQKGYTLPLPGLSQKQDFSDTIASQRLDCIVSSLAKCSRSKAEELISGGQVFVNSIPIEKTVKTVNEGDKITIRGKGKFEIVSLTDKTKKNRIILQAKKYV